MLDLSLVTSEYGRNIHPCKGCVSSAMPLCHWPCNCYPNHELGQADDWMAEIYARWVAAHAVVILGLIDAGAASKLDRYIGYYEPYCNGHNALDKNKAVQEETRNVARSVVQAVKALRAGRLRQPDKQVKWPRAQ